MPKFTNAPSRTDEPVEVETVKLAGGNVGIKLPSGDIADPTYVTASNLARAPQSHVDVVLAWIAGERERLRLRAEAAEAVGREVAAALKPTLEAQAEGRRKWVSKNFMDAA
jgi:hypothetical protein